MPEQSAKSHTLKPVHADDAPVASQASTAGKGFLKSAVILVCLLAAGWYGHESHWSLPFISKHQHSNSQAAQESSAALEIRPVGRNELELPSTEAMELIGLTTAEAVRREITEEIEAHGVVAYERKLVARLSPRVNGIVWRVEKHLGDAVRKGDVLAIIEAVPIGNAKADFLSALAVAESRSEQRRRLQNLPDVVSQKALQEARLSEREALVRLRNAEQTLINLGLPLRYQDFANLSDDERFSRLHFLGLPPDLAKTLDPSQTTSSLVTLTAPFDGQVISRDIGLGEVVQIEDTVFEIADSSHMWLLLDVRKEDTDELHVGQPLIFDADGVDESIPAQIDWISSEVDENTRTVQIRAEVENPIIEQEGSGKYQRRLRANTFGTARIRVREKSDALVVPAESVQWDHDGYLIFVQTSERRFRMVPVKKGISSQDHVEIYGAVEPGMKIVQRGSHVLKSQIMLSRMTAAVP